MLFIFVKWEKQFSPLKNQLDQYPIFNLFENTLQLVASSYTDQWKRAAWIVALNVENNLYTKYHRLSLVDQQNEI